MLNSLINNFNLDSFKISFFYFRYGVFVIAIIAFLETDDRFVKYFFYCIFLCFTVLIINGFYQYYLYGFKGATRISSFFGDDLILGSYVSRLWPIFFGLSIFFLKKKDKFFFILITIFVLSEILIFLSGERVAFFYVNLSAIFVIFFSNKLRNIRLIILITSLSLIVILSYFSPAAKIRIVDQTIKQMNLANTEEEIYTFSKQHTHHYITAYRMFLDNKVMGVGVKNFRNFCNDPKYSASRLSCSSHPHNTYIQILAETGIIGFLFLISAFIYFCIYTIKHAFYKFKGKHFFTDFEICILSGILIFIWPFAPTGNVFNNWLNIVMILYFPLLVWSRKLIKT